MIYLKAWKTSVATLGMAAAISCASVLSAQTTNGTPSTLWKADFPTQASLVDDIGAAERLEVADYLRTLTQVIPSAACHLHSDVAQDVSRELLIGSADKFSAILDALEFGDPDLGIIGTETNRHTLASIKALRDIWQPMDGAVRSLLKDTSDKVAITLIKEQNMPLFEASAVLLSNLSGEYSNPVELLQVDALMIDIAGRQSMLTQKIAKQACEIWTGNRSEERLTALRTSVDMFHMGINALHKGMPALAIPPAPTPEIEDALAHMLDDWDIVKADLEAILAGDISEEIRLDLYNRLNEKELKMDAVVRLYITFAKHTY